MIERLDVRIHLSLSFYVSDSLFSEHVCHAHILSYSKFLPTNSDGRI